MNPVSDKGPSVAALFAGPATRCRQLLELLQSGAGNGRRRMRAALAAWRALGTARTAPLIAGAEILVLAGIIPSSIVLLQQGRYLATLLPFLLFIPLLLGLFHGFLAGGGGGVLIALILALTTHFAPSLLPVFPKVWVICLIAVGMVSGEARDFWRSRLYGALAQARLHELRLGQFAPAYQALQISHAVLERQLAGSGPSLRAVLERVRRARHAGPPTSGRSLDGVADWILDIMVDVGQLQSASLHAVTDEATLCIPAAASFGSPFPPVRGDPLITEVLRTGLLAIAGDLHGNRAGRAMAAVPLVDATGKVHAVAVIDSMSFTSAHAGTFDLLAVLGRHLGDVLASRLTARQSTPAGVVFPARLRQLLQDPRATALPFSLVVCRVTDGARSAGVHDHVSRYSRAVDTSWYRDSRNGDLVILQLLCDTDAAGAASRVARLLQSQGLTDNTEAGIKVYHWFRDHTDDLDTLLNTVCATAGLYWSERRPAVTQPRAEVAKCSSA